ncbi:probable serine incorporator [Phalaenopsis equestris]|uniref:probable serine incorporator n=1 Tax=Phalaenopsis equestris TaxID=78828 RepID=UPI0009E39F23|nr:probable serine incorporator [Phalaenopsis equestris]
MYFIYVSDETGILNIFFITWTAILVKIMMAISLHSKVNKGLLSSGMMGLYIVFLCWSAIRREPFTSKRNSHNRISENVDWTTIFSFLFAVCSIVISTFMMGSDFQSLKFRKDEVQTTDDIPYSYELFHFIFSMGAMYFAMLFISWELDHPTRKWSIDVGWASTWIKFINEFLAVTLYLSTLMWPIVMRNKVSDRAENGQPVDCSV